MAMRILDIRPSEMVKLTGRELLLSIRAAEGRTIVCEIVCPVMPLLYDVTNAELVSAFGTDIILLNLYDAKKPAMFGITPKHDETVIHAVKRLAGRPVAVNLEPVDVDGILLEDRTVLEEGRTATRENARLAYEQGVVMIVLTGNPKTGVTNKAILKAVSEIREELGDKVVIAAGKMHGAGVGSETGAGIISKKDIDAFIDAGADIVVVPAPGTVPGITLDFVKSIGDYIHQKGSMLLTAIGTSQEGADTYSIRSIALNCKMAGSDIHHIGDAGFVGIAVPENIMVYSIAIRGIRHTYRRMAMKV